MRKINLFLALALVAFVGVLFAMQHLSGSDGTAATAPTPIALDRSYGAADAPVVMVMYASLTCSHCRDFHTTVLPEIEKLYIDTGKLRLVSRPFPGDAPALAAARLAQCVPPDQYFAYVGRLYRDQAAWSKAADPILAATQLAGFYGMTPDAAAACLADKAGETAILENQLRAKKDEGVKSTPTFFIGTDRLVGNRDVKLFQTLIDKHLAPVVPPAR